MGCARKYFLVPVREVESRESLNAAAGAMPGRPGAAYAWQGRNQGRNAPGGPGRLSPLADTSRLRHGGSSNHRRTRSPWCASTPMLSGPSYRPSPDHRRGHCGGSPPGLRGSAGRPAPAVLGRGRISLLTPSTPGDVGTRARWIGLCPPVGAMATAGGLCPIAASTGSS